MQRVPTFALRQPHARSMRAPIIAAVDVALVLAGMSRALHVRDSGSNSPPYQLRTACQCLALMQRRQLCAYDYAEFRVSSPAMFSCMRAATVAESMPWPSSTASLVRAASVVISKPGMAPARISAEPVAYTPG